MQYDDYLDLDALKRYAKALNQRAKSLNITGSLDAVTLRSIILESGGCCAWCGISIVKQDFEIEHIVPLVRGGDHQPDNLAVACPDCNRRKGTQHPAKFAQMCLNRSGNETPLVMAILQRYGITPTRQLSLFDTPTDTHFDLLDDDDLSD